MNRQCLTSQQLRTAVNLIAFDEDCRTCTCGNEQLHLTYRHCIACGLPNPYFDEALQLYHASARQHSISRAGPDCNNHAGEGFRLGMRIGWKRCPECTAILQPAQTAAAEAA
jgi:hypothetical protein